MYDIFCLCWLPYQYLDRFGTFTPLEYNTAMDPYYQYPPGEEAGNAVRLEHVNFAANDAGDYSYTDDEEEDYEGDDHSEYCYDDDDDEGEDIILKLLDDPLSHQDAQTMSLSAQEHGWALSLKDAIANSPHHQSMSDMWVAQYAIISKGDIPNALHRIQAFQAFEKEYHVDHSVEQGLLQLAGLADISPGLFLSLDVDPVTYEALAVTDMSRLNPQAMLEDHRTWKSTITGFYYYLYASQPTLATVRSGMYGQVDFGGFDWHNLSWEHLQKLSDEVLSLYPVHYSKVLAYNTNALANIMFAMVKKIFPLSLMKALQLGCRIPMTELEEVPRPLSAMYLQPSMEACNLRMMLRAKDLLLLRAKNESNFRL